MFLAVLAFILLATLTSISSSSSSHLTLLEQKITLTVDDEKEAKKATKEDIRIDEDDGEQFVSEDKNDNDLPTCQELMQQPFSPFADGAFLTRTTTPISWKMRRDGSRELTLPTTCRLKRYTAQEARQCFQEKHLLYIGDSLTRYLYLSLAYFIEHSKWPPRFGVESPCHHVDENGIETCSQPDDPNVCVDGNWKDDEGGEAGWKPFFRNIGGGKDGSVFRGRMEAPCVRGWGSHADEVNKRHSVENMKYVSSEEDGGRTTLSFIAELGWVDLIEPTTGWNFTNCALDASCRYSREEYASNQKRLKANDFDWNYTSITDALGSNGALRDQYKRTNYAFYNRGLWGKIEKVKADAIMKVLYNFTGGEDQNGRCFFRSTMGCERAKNANLASWEYNNVRKSAFDAGCEYFDLTHLTEEFGTFLHNPEHKRITFEYDNIFWDSVHYQPWVNEELNNLQLNIMCNTQH